MLREVNKIAQKHKLLVGNVAHLGDGNLHPLFMYDNRDPDESERAAKAGKEILAACVELEGTISGEHGIGLEKQDSMPLMFNPAELELMHRVKDVFDPEELLNPGKITPFEKRKPIEAIDSKVVSTSTLEKDNLLHDELVEIVGKDKVLTDSHKLAAYQVDEKLPHLAVFPANTEQVCQVIKTANRYTVPLISWGNGSKQAQGPPLTKIGAVLSLKNMNRLLELDTPNLTAKVEAGMNHAELQRELAKHGLLFPLEPAEIESATIGGSLSTNSNGPRRLLYGTTRDLVLGITAVTPTGEVVHVGGKTMKNVAGYDLRKLFLGSWGTLGVITEAILRLFYLPEEHKTMLLKFQNIENLSQLVRQISDSFLRPESMELIDAITTQSLEPEANFKLRAGELCLLIGLAGTKEVVDRHITEIQILASANNAEIVTVLSGIEEKEIWVNQRHIQRSLSYPDSGTIKGKAVVPSHRMEDMYQDIQQAAIRHGFQAGITGHAGNGILYPTLSSKNHHKQNNEMLALVADLIQRANTLGGFFMVESGPPEIRQAYDFISQRSDYGLMKRLKQALDPQSILNPGKVIRNL
jgi:FAD/FMN-containing dehydrogenase